MEQDNYIQFVKPDLYDLNLTIKIEDKEYDLKKIIQYENTLSILIKKDTSISFKDENIEVKIYSNKSE